MRALVVASGAALVCLAVVLAIALWPRPHPASFQSCQGASCTDKYPLDQGCGAQPNPDAWAAGPVR